MKFSTPLPKKKGDHHETYSKEKEEDEEIKGFLNLGNGSYRNAIDEADELSGKITCIAIHNPQQNRHHSNKKAEQISMEKHDLRRQQQMSGAAMLEKQLKAKWTLEELIDNQLKRFHAHYNEAMVITRPEDVAQLLMPKWTPSLELACVSWLGDWRPSAILELLQSLARSSYLSPSLADSVETEKIISQLMREIRIEEAIIDEEMAEIKATCILHLPFSPANRTRSSSPFACVQSELKKIKQVIIKGQQLRFKVLELIVKKVLSQVDAAEFLVVFAGIQDAIHQFAVHKSLHKGSVKVSPSKLGTV